MQDAYFALTYVHPDGEPMDYFELLDILQSRRHGDVTILYSPSPVTRDLLYFENGQVSKVKGFLSLQDFEETVRPDLNSFYEEQGFPQNILYMHLSVLSVSDPNEAERSEFISTLSARDVWKR